MIVQNEKTSQSQNKKSINFFFKFLWHHHLRRGIHKKGGKISKVGKVSLSIVTVFVILLIITVCG